MSKRKTVCIDFDGVVHSYESGWQGADVIPDPPIEGAIEAIEAYRSAGWHVAIHSSRTHQPGGIDAMEAWFAEHAPSLVGEVEFPTHKPPAQIYIDDRGHCFDGTWPSPRDLDEFVPWHKDGSPILSADWYQRNAARTMNKALKPADALAYISIKLGGETGELAEAIGKALYHKVDAEHPAPDASNVHGIRELVEEEVGDILWYLANLCEQLGLSLQDAMVANIEKLRTRYPDGFSPKDSEQRVDNPFLNGTEIEMRELKSSNLAAIGVLTEERSRALGFDGTPIVEVRFKNGGRYRYRDARDGAAAVLRAAETGESSGQAFHAFLRSHPRTLTAKWGGGQYRPLA